jgi:hypothetical protein
MRLAFSAEGWQGASEDCPDNDTLWASAAEELDPVADDQVILHLAQCAQCSSAWSLAREMVLPETMTVASVRETPGHQWLRSPWRRSILAMAATVLVGVGLGAALLLNREAAAPPVYREQRNEEGIITSVAPVELPRMACRLQWSAGPEGTLYDLIVTDGDLNVLLSVKGLSEAEYLLPEENLSPATREIFWRITAHVPGGGTQSSETFSTRITMSGPAPD